MKSLIKEIILKLKLPKRIDIEESISSRFNYAMKHGYFWLPCPLCGEYFGGHEWNDTRAGMMTDRPNVTQGICGKCVKEVMSRHPNAVSVKIHPITKEEVEERIMEYNV